MYQSFLNADNLGGFTEEQLYVDKVFDNYKEEILQHISMKIYQTIIQPKVQLLITSNKVKQMKAVPDYRIHYGIKKGTPITVNHITSLILYTDLSEYCTNFSSTFRKCGIYESIEDVKKRNSKYWWQAKFMREAIELYGYDTGRHNKEGGPFYSGIDIILVMPEFSLRLRGPTSTSKHIEVSMNFSKRDGIIISLNNNGFQGADHLPFIDASWLSQYPDEVC